MSNNKFSALTSRFALAAILLCSAISLTSCSDDDDDKPGNPNDGTSKSVLVGSWCNYIEGHVHPVRDGGLVFNADGTGYLYEAEMPEMKWAYDEKTCVLTIVLKAGGYKYSEKYKVQFTNADNFVFTETIPIGETKWEKVDPYFERYVREGKEPYFGTTN